MSGTPELTPARENAPFYRCPIAINFGSVHTRCVRAEYHAEPHQAFGMEQFPEQRIIWFHGDHREFPAPDRTEKWAWYPEMAASGD
jgi:hypothetical protein